MTANALDAIMEQAQVFASTYSLVGGPFDHGSKMTEAEEEKAELRRLIEAALSPEPQNHLRGNNTLLARVASIICEETCGLTSECKSREAAKALLDKGYLQSADEIEQSLDRAETAVVAANALQVEVDRLRKALADMLPPDLPWKRDADGVLIHHKVAAINAARAALAATSEGQP